MNLFAAVRSSGVSLRMLAPDGAPLQRRFVRAKDDAEVVWDRLVRGFEVETDEFVVVSDEALESVAPRKSRDIDLTSFVPVAELDPFLFEKAYVLTPAGETNKPYRLLADVLEREDKAGIATFVMRTKEYLVAILARGGILWAETLRFAGELRKPADVGLRKIPRADKADVDAFEKAIRGMAKDGYERAELVDRRSERLEALIARKRRSGVDIVKPKVALRAVASRAPDPDDESDADIPDLFQRIATNLRLVGDKSAPSAERDADEAGQDLADLSKAELYERAQAADIAGRSAMSKPQLVRALRKLS